MSQALVNEEGCDKRGEPTLNLAILMEMKPDYKGFVVVVLFFPLMPQGFFSKLLGKNVLI